MAQTADMIIVSKKDLEKIVKTLSAAAKAQQGAFELLAGLIGNEPKVKKTRAKKASAQAAVEATEPVQQQEAKATTFEVVEPTPAKAPVKAKAPAVPAAIAAKGNGATKGGFKPARLPGAH